VNWRSDHGRAQALSGIGKLQVRGNARAEAYLSEHRWHVYGRSTEFAVGIFLTLARKIRVWDFLFVAGNCGNWNWWPTRACRVIGSAKDLSKATQLSLARSGAEFAYILEKAADSCRS
jgi:hypothetical protein